MSKKKSKMECECGRCNENFTPDKPPTGLRLTIFGGAPTQFYTYDVRISATGNVTLEHEDQLVSRPKETITAKCDPETVRKLFQDLIKTNILDAKIGDLGIVPDEVICTIVLEGGGQRFRLLFPLREVGEIPASRSASSPIPLFKNDQIVMRDDVARNEPTVGILLRFLSVLNEFVEGEVVGRPER